MKILSLLLLTIFLCVYAAAQDAETAKIPEKSLSQNDCPDTPVDGTVRLKVTFDASGKVTNVIPVATLPCGLTEKAIEAAKQIKFTPEKKDGRAIAVVKTIEYKFSYLKDNDAIKGSNFDEKAEAIIQKAIKRLGGERYLAVKTVVGRGNFTQKKETETGLPSAFVDYIVYPNKERTEFKSGGARTIQTNVGETGWIADNATRTIKDQTPEQIADFKRGIRASLDYFLRGEWRKDQNAKLEYAGRREAGLGKRNDVLRLTYADGFAVEYEFAQSDATPAKSLYKRKGSDDEEILEEDRYAQFIESNGISAPLIVDHYRNGKQSSRINFESIEYNTPIAETLFAKPADVKKLK